MASGQVDLFTRRVRRPPPAPEFHLQCLVADILKRWHSPGWRYEHIPLGEFRKKKTAARLKRMGVVAGWPDFILLSPDGGRVHFLELKRRGEKLSEDQAEFFDWCVKHHVRIAVADNFKLALEILKTWGAVRVEISA